MAQSLVNIPTDIREVADDLEAGDEILDVYELHELASVSPFDGMRPGPENFPGSMILRRSTKGRVLCRQGDFGATAFQILTPDDALNVRRAQLKALGVEAEDFATALAKAKQKREEIERRSTQINQEWKDADDELRVGALSKQLNACLRAIDSLDDEIDRLQRRTEELLQEKAERSQYLENEIRQLESVMQLPDRQKDQTPRQVVEARLLVSTDKDRQRKGLLHRLVDRLRSRNQTERINRAGIPRYIPIDGPQDLDGSSLSAPFYEGDLFGEMSCMHLAPRSATVFVTSGTDDAPCYMIEILRNAFDSLRGSKMYKERLDIAYRERVMEMQVRSLPLFQVLTDDEYQWLAANVELVEFAPGEVIFDEYHSSDDCCYVVRSGVVKVSCNLGILLGKNEVTDFSGLCRELAAFEKCSHGAQFWQELSEDARQTIRLLAATPRAVEKEQEVLVRRAINEWIRSSHIDEKFGKTVADVIETAGLFDYASLLDMFSARTKEWSQLELRVFNRIVLEKHCPESMPRRSVIAGNERTLAYHGRGEIVGELALLLNQDRNATCLAFTHPLSGQKTASQDHLVPQRVEAVRITADCLQQLMTKSPLFRQQMEAVAKQRLDEMREVVGANVASAASSQSPEFESLGLAWGQQLMLVDLDKCTRCQECVKACVDAHDDGRTRLYLDGPRYGKYLVPVTCRKCVDPVCMIGCPVGAINRGSNGEIQISDWCIGCSKCADQCPYGSIQMDLLPQSPPLDDDLQNLFGPGYELRSVMEKAIVCDLCSSTPSGEPSCVYACPHDAAVRVNALEHFDEVVT